MSKKWSDLISRAERLLGGPAPFINLSPLLSTEAGFLASRARRLAFSVDHPFFDAVYAYLRGKSHNYPLLPLAHKGLNSCVVPSASPRAGGGLVTLLVGQCHAGAAASSAKLCNQHRKLSEIFDTVNLAIAIHKSLVATSSADYRAASTAPSHFYDDESPKIKDMEVTNKVATLAGDVLLASVSASLAIFRNARVVDVISESMGNMLEAEFVPLAIRFEHRTSRCNAATFDVGNSGESNAATSWLEYVGLARGSILGGCCQSTVLLTESSGETHIERSGTLSTMGSVPQIAYRLGYSWATLVRLIDELEFLRRVYDKPPIWSATGNNQAGRVPSGPEVLSYFENGLPEPTLMDAIQNCDHTSSLTHFDDVIGQYGRLGSKLATELRASFNSLTVSMQPICTERTSSLALNVLGDMVEELTNEAEELVLAAQ